MKLLISNKSRIEFKNFLSKLKIEYIETIDNEHLDKRIADHPDLSVFAIDDKNIIVEESVYDYYRNSFGDLNVIKGDRVLKKYPGDCIYNIVRFKKYYIHNENSEKNLRVYFQKKGINHLFVKQGYTRCSSIVLKKSILTSDYGIYKKLKDKINVILLKEEMIELDGFDRGFIGGSCGLVGNSLIFNGNIKKLQSYDIIYKQCEKENINLIYPDCDLLDTGSIMVIG